MERIKFIGDYESGLYSITDLTRRYSISRPTAYKWIERFEKEGPQGLLDRSHAPHNPANKTPQHVVDAIKKIRGRVSWCAKTIRYKLQEKLPEKQIPAVSTINAILKREGLVKPRRKKNPHPGSAPLTTEKPNDVWGADFKGQFKLGNTQYCYPLTVSDLETRFLLECYGLKSTKQVDTIPVFERLFKEFGLPKAIRTDNGVPFATRAIFGLSKLNVWWLKLGIEHQRIQPGKPTQNAIHERMHRTLKEQTARPPKHSFKAQQQHFYQWMDSYNFDRPHIALEGKTPASLYQYSMVKYPKTIPPPEYPGDFETRRVCNAGTFRFKGGQLFLSLAMIDEWIGFTEIDDGIWSVFFYNTNIARFDERHKKLF